LEEEKPLRSLQLLPHEETILSGFAFLSQKPLLIVYNLAEADLLTSLPPEVVRYAQDEGFVLVPICGKVEMEIAQLEEEEQGAFLKDLGLEVSARERFIQSVYQILRLVSFFTTGGGEVRAWPIPQGTTALKAAGKVHTDMERGFIRAEVIAFDDYLRYRGEAGCREAGKMRLEGKEYGVQDGDVVRFRFKV
jgi:ribosome-binding ATPase YchF (GTP1/OBG family)